MANGVDSLLASLLGCISRSNRPNRLQQFVGAAFIAYQLFRIARASAAFLLPRRTPYYLTAKYAQAGSWAVVTGGSDGIGRSLALHLAKIGFNVCVVARTQSKVAAVVTEITTLAPSVKAHGITFDFSTSSDAAYHELFSQLDALDIGILVNNVGISHTNAELFEEPTVQDDLNVLQVNCAPMIRLCKYIVPRLKSKRSGAIINLSSLSAVARAVPYLTTYAGTKAFNHVFSQSLAFELEPFGVDVLTVTPGMVSTNMTQGSATRRPRTKFTMVDVDAMARDTISQLGVVRETAGHRNHDVQTAFVRLLPQWFLGSSTYNLFKKISDSRKRKAAAAAAPVS